MRHSTEGGRAWLAPLLRLACAGSAAVLVVALAAHAAKPQTGEWRNTEFDYQLPVEQQTPLPFGDPCTWIVNPTAYVGAPNCTSWALRDNAWTWVGRCLWDADDAEQWTFEGILEPGESVSIQRCNYADGQEKLTYIRDMEDHPSMAVEISILDQTVTGQHEACILGPDYDGQADFPDVPGSNGGRAFLTPITITVRNTGTKTIRRQRVTAYTGLYYWTTYNSEWAGNRCREIYGERFGVNPAWRLGVN